MDQNGTLLEIEDKANLTVLIKTTKKTKNKTTTTRNVSKDMDLYHLREIYPTNMENSILEKQILDTAAKTGLDPLKTAFKKVVYKVAEGTGEFTGSKIMTRL